MKHKMAATSIMDRFEKNHERHLVTGKSNWIENLVRSTSRWENCRDVTQAYRNNEKT